MFMHVISMALQVAAVLQQQYPYLTNQHVNVYHNALPHHSAKMHFSVNNELTPHLLSLHLTASNLFFVSDTGRDCGRIFST
jgi:phage terminase Nu1 subunit (DNA packaging protein)